MTFPQTPPTGSTRGVWNVARIVEHAPSGQTSSISTSLSRAESIRDLNANRPDESASKLPLMLIWPALATAIRSVESIEFDEDDNKTSIKRMVPKLLAFMDEAAEKMTNILDGLPKEAIPDFRNIGLIPDHISTCDGVGIRLDWYREGRLLSLIAKPSYSKFISMHVFDGSTGKLFHGITPDQFIDEASAFSLLSLRPSTTVQQSDVV